MESDDMKVQKQRKIIMKVNGEKKEIVFNDSDKGSGSRKSSSKRKSSDRSDSSSKRKKSSDRPSSPSINKIIDKVSAELTNGANKASSSSSTKHNSTEKSTSSDKKNSSSHNSSSSTKNNSSSSISKPKSSSEHKSSQKSTPDEKLESKDPEKHISHKNSDSKPRSSEKSTSDDKSELQASEKHKTSKTFDSKHKSSEKTTLDDKSVLKATEKQRPSKKLDAIPICSEKPTSDDKFETKATEKHKSTKNSDSKPECSEKSTSDDKSELRASEKHNSSKKSGSKHKSTEKSSSVNKSEEKVLESSSQKHKSSEKSKENHSDKSLSSEIKHKSSSSTSKNKSSEEPSPSCSKPLEGTTNSDKKRSISSEKRSSSSKRSKSSEKSSSSQSKRNKSSDENRTESKEQKSKTKTTNDMILKAFKEFKEEMEKFKDETTKNIQELKKDKEPADKELPTFKSYVDLPNIDEEIRKGIKRDVAILISSPIENYPDEDYEFIYINGHCFPRCRFEYFTDPIDNILKYRKIADFSHLAECPPNMQMYEDFEAGCCSTSKINENSAPEQKVENEATLVPNTEIPLHEIIGLIDPQQILSNENVKIVSIKAELIEDDEILTKPVNFVSSTPNVENQCPPDSKLDIKLINIKLEPQPHCSKDIPAKIFKQESNTDSKDYFRIIPQNSANSEISAIENSENLSNMSQINRWVAIKNKNHGFKDPEALSSMMKNNSLFSLFKCMGIKCRYTTISYENFLEHLNIHQESNSLIKDYFLNCAYCLYKSEDPIELIEHYKNIHHNCIYQCNLCFYRAAEAYSVYDHQVYHHSVHAFKCKILECPSVFPKDEKIQEYKAKKKVEGIKDCLNCEFCPEKFIVPENYINHLKSSHHSPEEKDKSEELIKKLNTDFINNRIGKYQCLECEHPKSFRSNNKREMRKHLQQYPSKLHFICVRDTNQFQHMRITFREPLPTTKYKGDLEVLKNAEGIPKIATE